MAAAHDKVLENVIDQSHFPVDHPVDERPDAAIGLPINAEPEEDSILNKAL